MTSTDRWDRTSQGARRARLVEQARRFLRARRDAALGLAPTRILPRASADAWVLFWCAARRVDDAMEAGTTAAPHWRRRLRSALDADFAERCVGALLEHPAIVDADRLQRRLLRGLTGLEAEARFDRPRPMLEYLALLEYKSVPAMEILDDLLFPDEPRRLVAKHANLFAVSTQLGDDCRDVRRDLGRGRVFVTLEELRERPLKSFVGSPEFRQGRTAMCARFLAEADGAARRFQSARSRRRAQVLSAMWSHALATKQVRPTREPLRVGG
ncbi:MAG: hypothetical protein HYT80_05400 [Euryarchaeota archaeon]|nr:hypothetical protein [Euryarchaeota archaeon]